MSIRRTASAGVVAACFASLVGGLLGVVPASAYDGSVAPYWDRFTYDKAGNRTSWREVTRATPTVRLITATP